MGLLLSTSTQQASVMLASPAVRTTLSSLGRAVCYLLPANCYFVPIGTLEAPDEKSAIAEAAKQFNIAHYGEWARR
jgi:hypothetical protein